MRFFLLHSYVDFIQSCLSPEHYCISGMEQCTRLIAHWPESALRTCTPGQDFNSVEVNGGFVARFAGFPWMKCRRWFSTRKKNHGTKTLHTLVHSRHQPEGNS